MDHATDLGFRIKKLLEEYEGRSHTVYHIGKPNGNVNILGVWEDDGTHFIVTIALVVE